MTLLFKFEDSPIYLDVDCVCIDGEYFDATHVGTGKHGRLGVIIEPGDGTFTYRFRADEPIDAPKYATLFEAFRELINAYVKRREEADNDQADL